ncbi:LOW QUALITY PROTEIN: leucine-rich repeat-containing protein 9 [Phaethornis superciliosus]
MAALLTEVCLEKAFLQNNALDEWITFWNRKLHDGNGEKFNLVGQSLLMELETEENIHFEYLSNNPSQLGITTHNHVISLEDIRGLSKLQFFNLRWNKLKSKDINILYKHTPNIFSLNVLCLNYNHIESILPRQKLPNQVTSRQELSSESPKLEKFQIISLKVFSKHGNPVNILYALLNKSDEYFTLYSEFLLVTIMKH